MSDIHRGVLESFEYSTDYDPDDTASGTWVTVPRLQMLNNGAQRPGEEVQTADGINLIPLSALWVNNGVIPVALKSTDTWQNAIKTASDDLTPMWFRLKELGKSFYKIIGGTFGTGVRWQERAIPDPGDLEMARIMFTATGNATAQTIQEENTGSGS